MKLLRTSFSHLVREKVIQGQSRLWPEPADVPIEQLVQHVSAHTGVFEYQLDNHTETGLSSGNFYNQGAMGYGDPPIGPGTKPYTSFLSNKTPNLTAVDAGVMTGDPDVTPSVSLQDVSFKGFGATYAVGQAQQYRYIEPDNPLNCQAGNGKHVLFSVSGLKGDVGDYTAVGWSGDEANILNFVYETTGETSYNVYVERGDGTLVSTPQSYRHFVNSYGRMMPVSIFLNEDGTGTFRVDNSTTTFNITTMQDKDVLNYSMPIGGTLGIKISGLTPHVDIASFGMTAAISRLTNVAVNDNDDSDNCGDVGLPPFIHGVTCSPIRGAEQPESTDWQFPSLVHSSTDDWTAFSENNPVVPYGLSAVMDNQTFDTRGVATGTLSADLDIYLTQASIADRIGGANVTNSIEAINIKAYNAATFNNSELAVKIHDTLGDWDTDWTVFPGLNDDPSLDSHVTFFSKLSGGFDCNSFEFSDFKQDMVIKLRAQNPGISAPDRTPPESSGEEETGTVDVDPGTPAQSNMDCCTDAAINQILTLTTNIGHPYFEDADGGIQQLSSEEGYDHNALSLVGVNGSDGYRSVTVLVSKTEDVTWLLSGVGSSECWPTAVRLTNPTNGECYTGIAQRLDNRSDIVPKIYDGPATTGETYSAQFSSFKDSQGNPADPEVFLYQGEDFETDWRRMNVLGWEVKLYFGSAEPSASCCSIPAGGTDPESEQPESQQPGSTFTNITTNYLFHNCQMSAPINVSTGHSYVGMQGPPVSEFSRDGSILIRAWKQKWEDSTTYISSVEVLKIDFDTEGNMVTSRVKNLRSNIASSYWGHCAAINDDGTIIAVADKGVAHASGAHGVIVMHKLDLANETIAETQIIYLPLSNQDYTIDGKAGSYDYETIEKRNLNVRLSGDGKIMIASFAQNYTAANPKSIFIYNLNESNQQYELVQTINGIGFQDIKLSKDGTTLVVKCGYFPAGNGYGSYEAGDYLNAAADFDPLYFHGLKIFKKNTQNTFVENASLSIFDLGIEEAVRTADVDWNMPIALAFGGILDINRYGNAIVYQFPDQVQSYGWGNRAFLIPADVQEAYNTDRTGPVAVITWDGTNWNRLGDFFLYDSGTVGYQFRSPDTGSRQPTAGGISENGTLLMLPSRNFDISSDYKMNFNFMKWTGSSWSKITREVWSNGSNWLTTGHMSSCMSKQPHPTGKSLIGFLGTYDNNVPTAQWAFTFSEECSTELLG